MKYLSIDLETTGLDPESSNVIEFAAILDDTAHPEVPHLDLKCFHCYLAPPEGGYRGSPVALGMNGAIFKKIGNILKSEGAASTYSLGCVLSPDRLGKWFKDWLKEQGFDLKRGITGAGKNFGTFDLQFIKRLPGMPRFHHRVLDPAMFYVNALDGEIPSLETCMARAGLIGKIEHRAIDDAIVVIQLIRRAFENTP